MARLALLVQLAAGTWLAAASRASRPSSHQIAAFPWLQQLTDFECGEASLGMVFAFFAQREPCVAAAIHPELGPMCASAEQRANVSMSDICNVAECTHSYGTMVANMRRAAYFSAVSSSLVYGREFPVSPSLSFGRALGFGAAVRSGAPWLEAAKDAVAQDRPVLMLTAYDAEDTEGHYRVLVGYDDERQALVFADPWGRGTASFPVFTQAEFLPLWNYTQRGHGGVPSTAQPYWGMVVTPWTVEARRDPASGAACVSAAYGAPWPDASAPVATNVTASLFDSRGALLTELPLASELRPGASATACTTVTLPPNAFVAAFGWVAYVTPASPNNPGARPYPERYSVDTIGGFAMLP